MTRDPVQRTWSPFGLALGVALIVVGALVIWSPPDMIVYHGDVKVRRVIDLPTTEHVTPNRAAWYGGVLVVLGIAVAAFAVMQPRQR